MGSRASWSSRGIVAIGVIASSAGAQTLRSDRNEAPELEAPEADSGEPQATQARWYGWQTLAADGASAALIATGVAWRQESDEAYAKVPATFGVLSFLFAAPIIHAAGHDSGGKFLGSLGLRAGVPIVGGFVGMALYDCGDAGGGVAMPGTLMCWGAGFGLGAIAGAIVASGLDAAFLGHERVPVAPPPQFTLRVAPMMDAAARPAGASVHGTF